MSSFKAFIDDGSKVHTIILLGLTVENLRQQISLAVQPTHAEDVIGAIIDGKGCDVESDQNVVDAFTKDPVFFTVRFRPRAIEKMKKTEEKKEATVFSYEVKNALVLLAGAMKYKQQSYLEDVKQDLHILQMLFEFKLGYHVVSTYNPQNPNTESLTLNELNKFLSKHRSNLRENCSDNDNGQPYDGLIFVWCGHGGFGSNRDTLITSDNKIKGIKDIQDEFATKTEYFAGKPKIFIKIAWSGERDNDKQMKSPRANNARQKNVWYGQDVDVFTIFVNTAKKQTIGNSKRANAQKGSHFANIFCQSIEKNMDKSFDWNVKKVIETVFDQALRKEVAQTVSVNHSELYLVPRSKQPQSGKDNGNREIKDETEPKADSDIPPTLDLKKYCDKNWRKANVEAAKIAEEMINKKERGLIVIAYNSAEWANSSFVMSMNDDNGMNKQQFGEYWMYVIKCKLQILNEVNIAGNVYAIDNEIQCKGNVTIMSQLFITTNAIVDSQLKQAISPIPWNTKVHYNVPARLQDFEEKGEQCSKKRLYNDAILHLQKHLQLSVNTFGLDHPYVAISYNLLGLTHDSKKQYDKAIEYFEKALKVILKRYGDNHALVAQLYHHLGNTYANKKRLDKSIEYHERALNIMLDMFRDNHTMIADLYYDLGNDYFKKIDDKAIEYYEKSLKIRLHLLGDSHADVANVYYQLGNIHLKKEQYDKATKFYEESLKINVNIFGTNHVSVASSYSKLGKIYLVKGQIDRAIDYHANALKIRVDLFGLKHDKVAASYQNLGNANFSKKECEKAHDYYEKALKIRVSYFGASHSKVSDSYNGLGNTHFEKEEYDKALESYEIALKIRLDVFGVNHNNVADSYANAGFVYCVKEKYEKAIDCHEKALNIRIALFGMEHIKIGSSYDNLGNTYLMKGYYSKALEYYEKELHILSNIVDKSRISFTDLYNNFGTVYLKKKQYAKAIEYYEKALQINIFVFGHNHANVASSYNKLGNVYAASGKYDQAIESHTKALKMRRNLFGMKHSDVADSYHDLGNVYYAKSNDSYPKSMSDKVMDSFKKALQIRLSLFGAKHRKIIESHNDFGHLHLAQYRLTEATEYYEKALRMGLDMFGASHSEVANSYQNLASLHELKNTGNAFGYYEKALKIRLNIFGFYHADVATTYFKMAPSSWHSKALEYYGNALKIRIEIFGINSSDVDVVYERLGDAYSGIGRNEKAIEYFEHSLKIKKEIFGQKDMSISSSAERLMFLCEAHGNKKKALQFCEEAWKQHVLHLGEYYWRTLRMKQKARQLNGEPIEVSFIFYDIVDSF
ncbi:hypothetical protein RFI_25648 [Reticulomyxa filosa]|uniref:Uncharacterized protein n=1 Tax=Reticulomyxa filosa TaxID=46433 RepID=X6MCI4_RETFI|nr:hypothetical protein RFI_25648 [Reticulomyxa filosa]|eukprot:ETO11728.1 hypothetical protein RFI_25648 [Reticulomyxa filosa]